MKFVYWFLAILGVLAIVYYFIQVSSAPPPSVFLVWTPEGYNQVSKTDQDTLRKRWMNDELFTKESLEHFKLMSFKTVAVFPRTSTGTLLLTYLGEEVEQGIIAESNVVVLKNSGFYFPEQPYLKGNSVVVSYYSKNWAGILALLVSAPLLYLFLLTTATYYVWDIFRNRMRQIRASC